MARSYSIDLRERVLRVHEAGEGSPRELADCRQRRTVCGCLGLACHEARRSARAQGGGGRRPLGGADSSGPTGVVRAAERQKKPSALESRGVSRDY
jgi:hypothetical protein